MLKKSVLLISFLIIISGVALFVQWIGYEKTSMASKEANVRQEINVEHNEAGLTVKHTFTRLEPGEPLEAIMPANALQASCRKEEGTCSFRGQSIKIIPEGDTFSVTYSIKLPSFQTAVFLSDWSIKLKDAEAERTVLHFTEKQIRKGRWFSSLGPSQLKKMDLIDYYQFQGEGEPGVLYWQMPPLQPLFPEGKLAVYGQAGSQLDRQQLTLIEEGIKEKTVVILTDQHPPYMSDRLILARDDDQLFELAESFIQEKVVEDYRFEEGEDWLGYLITSYKLGRPAGSEKVKMMYGSLNKQLTDQEKEEWQQALFRLTDKTVTAERLDQALSAVKGLDTDFFVKNKLENHPFQSLVFYDNRPITVNGSETELRAVAEGEQLFFPFTETLQALGYEVKELTDGKTLLVKREYNTYRFYLDQNRFILNEERYGLYEHALRSYNGRLYISQQWLQKIFLVAVQNEKNINIQELNL
ncbi:stalk domain-containing protein [Bacillus badius]|uniref:stalk domain-containing protein n=1 Tax=Bacillus badius TaxID=1455 RepID=UPI0007B0729B|nr:stalk domain-containing protein [Bacillus badius]KZO01565.1 hypothetical protein A4244_00330 [Bacillus badius]MED0667211.1 stalk domain-containing protein [Bacillus badius]OCS89959.1 hypothetical protein A6M11_00330 [Bacillus badius]OVE53486.1 hypothetical protein B1A98_01390 [Bacillus badius]TDW05845.1 copper amine oxidase-like protein [Bacillus badius]